MQFTCTDKLGRFPVQTLGKDFGTFKDLLRGNYRASPSGWFWRL
jgi:hypothetical protein